MVIATQNPIEMEGTYALPEAQRDRFMARVSVGYPVEAAEIAMLNSHTHRNPLDDLEAVTDASEIRKLCAIVGQVYVSEAVQRYSVALTSATRRSDELSLGASPRATLHLVRAAKASAAMQGRDYVLPDDVRTARPTGADPPAAAQRRGRDERPVDRRDPRRHHCGGAGAGPAVGAMRWPRAGPASTVREALVRSDGPRAGLRRSGRDRRGLRRAPGAAGADPGRHPGAGPAPGHRGLHRPQPLPSALWSAPSARSWSPPASRPTSTSP